MGRRPAALAGPRAHRQEGPQPQPRSELVVQPYVVFNTVSPNANGALGKVKVRQALSEAISRTNIIQVLGGPKLNQALSHVLPPVIIGGEKNFDLYPYDATKAKADLAAAGYPNGLSLK